MAWRRFLDATRMTRLPRALRAAGNPSPRYAAAAAYLHERDGDLATAARLYTEAADQAPNLAERNHLARQAARLNSRGGG